MLSEVDWGAHHPSVFLFLVNIDYDAKPIEFFMQGLWGEPQHRTPYIPLIGPQTDSLATGQSFLAMVIQLQWLVVLGDLSPIHKLLPCPSFWWHHLDLKIKIYGYIHIFQDNTSFKFPLSTHTHTHTNYIYIYLHIIMHVSTRTCYIHHKRGVTEV